MFATLLTLALAPDPIIDVHLHAMRIIDADPPGEHFCMEYLSHAPTIDPVHEPLLETLARWRQNPDCPIVVAPPNTDEEILTLTIEILERRNIRAVVSGEEALVAQWRAAAPSRIIPARTLSPGRDAISPETLATSHAAGDLEVLGEIAAQYLGHGPDSNALEPYWAMAEAHDIPVGIHIGYMPPGASYWGMGARISLGDAMLLEDVLIRHPRLRVYIMHAGYPQIERTIALMQQFPQVYADTGMLQAIMTQHGYDHFLERMFEAGLGKRLMYGTDQIIWPSMIEHALDVVERSEAITPEQKRDLLFNNAARFLRIDN